ncbi:MAG: fumarylacetoacetate hydrolase [Burkholderiales bacterium]|nr:fumarylacetoacetate hydrolase [Burkholderiales bacterium]
MKLTPLMAAAATLLGTAVHGACLTDVQAAQLADHFFSRTAAPDLDAISEADARCSRARFNAVLAQRHGPVIGYKVGLTNPAIQRMLKGDQPTWGVLYQGMVLAQGARVAPAFGARPTVEADLLVRVGSAAINRARTPMEVLEAIDQVIPFIELPDMLVATPLKLDARSLTAINVAARMGVTGTPIAVPPTQAGRQALHDGLRDMKLSMTVGTRSIGQGVGSDLMGHPLNAAIWLAQALAKEGLALEPGQLISLGSFPPVIPPPRGQKFVVTYNGLPGAEPVSVQFDD